MKNLIIYHKSDFDGICSGEICRLRIENPTLVGWDYGDPVPDVEGFNRIFLVDLSIAEILERTDAPERVTWIDHHKTAIERWDKPQIAGVRLDGVAACRLCWQYFLLIHHFPTKEDFVERRVTEPRLVRLLGEYDVWDHRDPDALPLQYGLKAIEVPWRGALLEWDDFQVGEAVKSGRFIRAYMRQLDAKLMERGGWTMNWEGFRFLVFNGHGNSAVFDSAIRPEHDGLLLWSHNGKKVHVSLYGVPGQPGHDFSPIAKKYGGGGHRQACGFPVGLGDWTRMLLSRHLEFKAPVGGPYQEDPPETFDTTLGYPIPTP